MNRLEQLMDILSQNAEGYRLLAEQTEMERGSIEKGLLENLGKIVKEKETIGSAIKTLEDKRLKLVKEIGNKAGLRANTLTLGALADIPKNRAFRKRILAIREKLLKAAGRAKKLNDFNRALVSKAMLSVMGSIKFANGLMEPAVTYSSSREIKTRKTPGAMIKKSF